MCIYTRDRAQRETVNSVPSFSQKRRGSLGSRRLGRTGNTQSKRFSLLLIYLTMRGSIQAPVAQPCHLDVWTAHCATLASISLSSATCQRAWLHEAFVDPWFGSMNYRRTRVALHRGQLWRAERQEAQTFSSLHTPTNLVVGRKPSPRYETNTRTRVSEVANGHWDCSEPSKTLL